MAFGSMCSSGTILLLGVEPSDQCRDHRPRLRAGVDRSEHGASPETATGNDVPLEDIARLADVFYIGGTKVGAMFGEVRRRFQVSLPMKWEFI